MRIIKMLGAAFVAVLALGAVAAAGASALEWLLNGKPITAKTAVKSTGELLLKDDKEKIAVKCSGHDEGSVSPEGKDEITSITGLSGELNAPCTVEEGSLCESATAMAVNLPWATELVTVEGAIRDLITTANSGWAVTCKTIIGEVTDTCEGMTSTGMDNVTEGVLALFDAISRENPAECSRTKEKVGLVTGSDLIEESGLTVS